MRLLRRDLEQRQVGGASRNKRNTPQEIYKKKKMQFGR